MLVSSNIFSKCYISYFIDLFYKQNRLFCYFITIIPLVSSEWKGCISFISPLNDSLYGYTMIKNSFDLTLTIPAAMLSSPDVVSHPLNVSTWKRLVSVCSQNSHRLSVCDSHILTASVRNSRMILKSQSWRRAACACRALVCHARLQTGSFVQARPWRMYTAVFCLYL